MIKDSIKKKLGSAILGSPYRHLIRRAALFGSYLHGTERPESDIDVLVEFEPTMRVGLFSLIRIENYLKEAMGVPVDLVTPGALSHYFRTDILRSAESVYEG